VFGLASARRAYSWDMRQMRQPSKSLCRNRTERTLIGRWKDEDKNKRPITGVISELEDQTQKRVLISQSLKIN
jgi:hypothetical protein